MIEKNLHEQKFILLFLDLVALFAALHLAIHVRYTLGPPLGLFEPGYIPWSEILRITPYLTLTWVLCFKLLDLYGIEGPVAKWHDELLQLIKAVLLGFLVLLSATFFYREFNYSRGMVLSLMPTVFLTTWAGRLLFRAGRRRFFELKGIRTNVAIIGDTVIGRHLADAFCQGSTGYHLAGFLDAGHEPPAAGDERPLLGRSQDLAAVKAEHGIDTVIIADSRLTQDQVQDIIDTCLTLKLNWNIVPSIYELMLDHVRLDVVGGIPLLGMRRSNIYGLNYLLKRFFDLVVATLMLLILSPIMVAVALAIKVTSPGPIFFRQERVGLNGKTFDFIKFRTMRADADDRIHREYARKLIGENEAFTQKDGQQIYKIPRDPRIIPIGHFLRKYSIDELPQLFNVLKGDMSLIGPRPPIPYEVEIYREWHKKRFDALPGITGLWQVSGRNHLSFEEMVRLDIEYIENWSFGMDLKIMFKTVGVVLFGNAY